MVRTDGNARHTTVGFRLQVWQSGTSLGRMVVAVEVVPSGSAVLVVAMGTLPAATSAGGARRPGTVLPRVRRHQSLLWRAVQRARAEEKLKGVPKARPEVSGS